MCRLNFSSRRLVVSAAARWLVGRGRRILAIVMSITVVVAVSACGNKGDLYLKEPDVVLPGEVAETDLTATEELDAGLDEEELAERRRRQAEQDRSGTD